MARGHPGGPSATGLLGLQRRAGNAAVTRLVQRALAAPGIDELVEQIAIAIPSKRNMSVFRHLQFEVGRIDPVDARYREKKGRSIRDDLLVTNHRDDGFVRCLAQLHAPQNMGADAEPWAQLGLALIPPGTADTLLVNILYEHDLAGRKRWPTPTARPSVGSTWAAATTWRPTSPATPRGGAVTSACSSSSAT